MSQMVGADIGELRELAAAFTSRAAQLKSIEAQLNWRIHAAPWKGHDVNRFEHDWNTRHRKVIIGAALSISNAANDLLAHAEQQEIASSAGYAGGIPPMAVLKAQEAARIGALGTAGWLAAAGLAGAAFYRAVASAHGIAAGANAAALSYLRARRGLEVLQKWNGVVGRDSIIAALKRSDGIVTSGGLYKTIHYGAGRVLAPIGAVIAAVDFADSVREGDAGGALVSGVSVIAGVASTAVFFGAFTPAAPVILAAAGVWAVGSLAYEHRETLGKAASWVAGKVADGATRAGEVLRDSGKAAATVVHQAADTAKSVINRITNPLRSLFG